jgi:hypothetical protein
MIDETEVAASGIPDSRRDHAIVIARFAMDCMLKMRSLSHQLELAFGPDTGDLSLRIGIHSGPVTGGFLKGKGARFQLFGDTMNVTDQILQSSKKGCILLSKQTADLLAKAGKAKWVVKREEDDKTLERGRMQTFWLNTGLGGSPANLADGDDALSRCDSSEGQIDNDLWNISHDDALADRKKRLIDWNVEVLQKLLKQIVARRNAMDPTAVRVQSIKPKALFMEMATDSTALDVSSDSRGYNVSMPLDEVKEIIALPEFDPKIAKRQKDPNSIEIPDNVLAQLRFFVTTLAEMYRNNPFHNFAHASHVVMSVIKHMNRIIAPKEFMSDDAVRPLDQSEKIAAALHDHTYGITSDPLTQFACVFSALIHDLDHPGVPNPRLIEEAPELAARYKNRSVAEQNSFDLAWNLLMEVQFDELRAAIAGNSMELARFRQLVINSVMATDLGDKELKALRNARWDKAFQLKEDEISLVPDVVHDAVNRKATIVIEHLIQAADVSHTMQHWEIYREWNENLFKEMYEAYRTGRAEKNPADFWYDGEIGFFDYYVIPLSKKLSECGVFGVSSDENLNYAMRNRESWVLHGREVVADMVRKVEAENHTDEEAAAGV